MFRILAIILISQTCLRMGADSILSSGIQQFFQYQYFFVGCFKFWGAMQTGTDTLQRHNTENSKQKFPKKELRGLSPNFHIHVSVSNLYFPTIGLLILLKICGPILEIYKSLTDTRMWKLGLRPRNSFSGNTK
jgi:hypothetical protein